MKELIQLSDLKIVGQLGDNVLLFLESKNVGKENPSAVQLNLGNNTYKIDFLQKFLKFTPFEEVPDNNDINKYYRNIIYRKLSDETIYNFLNELTEANVIETIFKAYDNGMINDDILEKALSKYGASKHIERVKVEKNGKVFYENRNVGGGKEGDKKPEKQYSEEELKDHAKSSPKKDLERHISEGTDESLRKVAHEELKRREDEEHKEDPKEEVDELTSLRETKDNLLKDVEKLTNLKKKLYSDKDISEPKSKEEKDLDKNIADIFSEINSLVKKINGINKIKKSEEEDLNNNETNNNWVKWL